MIFSCNFVPTNIASWGVLFRLIFFCMISLRKRLLKNLGVCQMGGDKESGGVCKAVKELRPVCKGVLKDFDLCLIGCKANMTCVYPICKYLIFILFHTSYHNFLTGSKVEERTHPEII